MTPSFRRWAIGLAIALLPFFVVVAARWSTPPAASAGDYAQYLMHAKALAEGRPYSDIGYIYSRHNAQVGPRNQPPGWPVVLTPFVAAFGTDYRVYRLLQAVLVVLVAGISGWYFARRDGPWIGIATAAMVAIALEGAGATDSANSDPFFCVLLWITLLIADGRAPMSARRGMLVAALAAATISVRVAGIALVPALVLRAAFSSREERRGAWTAAGLLVIGAVVIGVILASEIPFLERALRGNAADLMHRVQRGVRTYHVGVLSGTLYPFPWDVANDVYHVAMLVPLAFGAAVLFREFRRSVLFYLIPCYIAILLLSPVREGRYVWPLFPVLAFAFFTGIRALSRRIMPRLPALASAQAGVVLSLALSTASAVRLAAQPPPPSLIADPATLELFDWLRREHTTKPIRVSFTNPRVLTLMTGIPAMPSLPRTPDLLEELRERRISHVIALRYRTRYEPDSVMSALTQDQSAVFPEVFVNEKYAVHLFVADSASVVRTPTSAAPRAERLVRE